MREPVGLLRPLVMIGVGLFVLWGAGFYRVLYEVVPDTGLNETAGDATGVWAKAEPRPCVRRRLTRPHEVRYRRLTS
jgi:hypothetical protein